HVAGHLNDSLNLRDTDVRAEPPTRPELVRVVTREIRAIRVQLAWVPSQIAPPASLPRQGGEAIEERRVAIGKCGEDVGHHLARTSRRHESPIHFKADFRRCSSTVSSQGRSNARRLR